MKSLLSVDTLHAQRTASYVSLVKCFGVGKLL